MSIAETADRPAEAAAELHPTGFGYHVIYAGEKHDAMVDWYATLFNVTPVVGEASSLPDLIVREDVDTIAIARRPALDQDEAPFRTGIFHMAWSFASLAELVTVYTHARGHGIMPQSVLNTGILLQVYYVDPEGNFLEFEVDAHDTSAATQEAQRSGRRDREMAHWIYDLEVIRKMLEAGWSDYDILDHDKYHAAKAAFA